MPSLYNCRHNGDQYRISKFDTDWNVEASYLCDLVACECPAGHRPTCRHRQMLPKFIQREHIGDEWFFDFDRGGWVQGASKDLEEPFIDAATLQAYEHIDKYGEGNPPEPSLDRAMGADADSWANLENAFAPAGLGQASEPRPYDAFDYTNRGELKNLHQPSLSPTPTIRRRV